MRLHITAEMIDASMAAMRKEAIKDGHDVDEMDNAKPEAVTRFREVLRSALQAAAEAFLNPQR